MPLTKEEQAVYDALHAKLNANKKTVHVIRVLDSSSSMQYGVETTISAFNEQQDTLKNSENIVTDTLYTFADTVTRRYIKQPIAQAERLSLLNYVPKGWTALYDAVGDALTDARVDEDLSASYLLSIFTDGEENNSTRFQNISTLKSRIEELKATGRWTITVAGPKGSVDLFTKMGIPLGNIATYNPSSINSRKSVSRGLVASTAHYMSNVSAGVAFSDSAYSSVMSNTDVSDE